MILACEGLHSTRLVLHTRTHSAWTQPHGLIWGFLSPRETWAALYYAVVPIATAAAAADRAGSVCVCVCVSEGEEQVSAEMGEHADTTGGTQDMRILRRHTCRA